MNKREVLDKVAEATDQTKAEAERTLDALLTTIAESLGAGEPVVLAGFGTFEVRQRAARTGRNPQTGEELDIPASKAAAFKPASALKQRVNGG